MLKMDDFAFILEPLWSLNASLAEHLVNGKMLGI